MCPYVASNLPQLESLSGVVYVNDCDPQPISSIYEKLEIATGYHKSAAIDPASLIKLRKMGEYIVVQCSGFRYFLDGRQLRRLNHVFVVSADRTISVKTNSDLISLENSTRLANYPPCVSEQLVDLDDTYSHQIDKLYQKYEDQKRFQILLNVLALYRLT